MEKYAIVKFTEYNVYKNKYSVEYCLIDKSNIIKNIPPHSLIYSYDEEMIATSDSKKITKNNGFEYFVIAATNNRDYSYSLPSLNKLEVEKLINNKNELLLDEAHPLIAKYC